MGILVGVCTPRRIWLAIGCAPIALAGLYYAKWVEVDYRLHEVTPGYLYQSAAMPARPLLAAIERHGIRTVIDLREPGEGGASAEPTAAGVNFASVPTPTQVQPEHAEAFLLALAASEPPVLVHCRHGEGRSVLMCAIHRVANEGWSPEAALAATVRLPAGLRFLSRLWPGLTRFRPDSAKGRLVLGYRPCDPATNPTQPGTPTEVTPNR